LRAEALEIRLPEKRGGYVYVIADAHLGDARAAPEDFLAMLRKLRDARAIVFLGDLFKVWLAPPKFWSAPVRTIMEGFAAIRATGVPIVFVVGNREFLLPADAAEAEKTRLPFDWIVHGMAVLHWNARRYGLTHGDLVNREDEKYLRWRRLSRGRWLTGLFRAMPGALARATAARLEASLANTNQAIKIVYPESEVRAFAEAMTPDLDAVLIGHFHLDVTVPPAPGRGYLRIVPDWFSRKTLLRLESDGAMTRLTF
jgi:UDP-2,3-diacylglucosamine hydrolase